MSDLYLSENVKLSQDNHGCLCLYLNDTPLTFQIDGNFSCVLPCQAWTQYPPKTSRKNKLRSHGGRKA